MMRTVNEGDEAVKEGMGAADKAGETQEETQPPRTEAEELHAMLEDEEKLLASKGLGRAKRLLGLSDDQLRTAIRKTRSDLLRTGAVTGQSPREAIDLP